MLQLLVPPDRFQPLLDGRSRAVLLRPDVDVEAGDPALLREYLAESGEITGRWVRVRLTHVERCEGFSLASVVALSHGAGAPARRVA